MSDKIRMIAYWIWRALPPGFDLDDVQSEAVLGAMLAPTGAEVVAARRAIYDYLRRERPGSRGNGRMCMKTVWWLEHSEADQESEAIKAQQVERVKRAVELLTVKELLVINRIYRDDVRQTEIAAELRTTEAYVARLKRRALGKLREAIA